MHQNPSNIAGSSPVIGPDTTVDEDQSLDVMRIRLDVLKLPHQRECLYLLAPATYT